MLHLARQFLLPITDPLAYIEAIATSRRAKRVDRRQRKAIRQLRSTLLAFCKIEQLDLFGSQQAQRVEPIAELTATAAFYKEVAVTWTDKQVVALCDGMIKASLEGLRDFKNDERRRELFAWFAPCSRKEDLFSMAFCCAVAGLDPDVISAQVLRMYRPEIVAMIGEEDRVPTRDIRQQELAFN